MAEGANLSNEQVYAEFLGTCTQCGKCVPSCESLMAARYTLGDIADAMLSAQDGAQTPAELASNIAANPSLIQAVRGCFFCDVCQNTCFAHNDVCTLVYAARQDFNQLGLIPRDAYSSVLVDQEWDIFTAYRAIYGINLEDLKRHLAYEGHEAETDCKVAFFPGCSLTAYAPNLTREIFAELEKLGGKTTLIDHCCGSPLRSAGFPERADALCDRSAEEVATSGADVLVCVCPGCANAMRETFARRGQNVRVESLPGFLARHGFEPKRTLPQAPLYLSKACQDRDGSYLEETCAVLGIDATTPVIYDGCCGAGGAVSAFQPERQAAQASEKLAFAPDGALVVSMCPTCTYTYAYRMMEAPRNIENKHYAELLFEEQFDWNTVFEQLMGMYSGPYGAWLAEVFA